MKEPKGEIVECDTSIPQFMTFDRFPPAAFTFCEIRGIVMQLDITSKLWPYNFTHKKMKRKLLNQYNFNNNSVILMKLKQIASFDFNSV